MKRHESNQEKYWDRFDIEERTESVDMVDFAIKAQDIVHSVDKSFVKLAQEKIDWTQYRLQLYKGNPYILREMCDRCGKVWVPPNWRKIRSVFDPDLGLVFVETGLCRTCINASVYVDKYLDGQPLCETDAKKLFYTYAAEYEQQWKMVLAAAPLKLVSEDDWHRACTFFNGCAFCGNTIEVRAMYFPTIACGQHTPWNVIPLCSDCMKRHYTESKHHVVFSSHLHFNKTKTTRMYLIQQMRRYDVYIDPIMPYMERFYETKTLKGSE